MIEQKTLHGQHLCQGKKEAQTEFIFATCQVAVNNVGLVWLNILLLPVLYFCTTGKIVWQTVPYIIVRSLPGLFVPPALFSKVSQSLMTPLILSHQPPRLISVIFHTAPPLYFHFFHFLFQMFFYRRPNYLLSTGYSASPLQGSSCLIYCYWPWSDGSGASLSVNNLLHRFDLCHLPQ